MIKLRHLILLEDFKTQAKKYIESGIEKGVVASYIEKFKKIRDAKPAIAKTGDVNGLSVPKGNDRFDIDKYKTFKELELFVDYVVGQVANVANAGKKFDKIEVDADIKPVVAANGLEIYYAKDKHACIKYKGGRPYNWCVSRSDSSNLYNTYRYKYNEPSFYFVKDVAATEEEFKDDFTGKFKNPWHFFVVQSTNNPDQFIVTSAKNDGDNPMSWEELVNIVPKLNGLRKYFTHVPLTQKEKDNYNRFMERPISDEEFVKFSYEDKEAFLDIAIPNIKLTTIQFASLPIELKNKFIGFGVGLTDEQYEMIKSDKNLMKRYYQISLRKFEEFKKSKFIRLNSSEIQIIQNSKEFEESIKNDENVAEKLLRTCKNKQQIINILLSKNISFTYEMITTMSLTDGYDNIRDDSLQHIQKVIYYLLRNGVSIDKILSFNVVVLILTKAAFKKNILEVMYFLLRNNVPINDANEEAFAFYARYLSPSEQQEIKDKINRIKSSQKTVNIKENNMRYKDFYKRI